MPYDPLLRLLTRGGSTPGSPGGGLPSPATAGNLIVGQGAVWASKALSGDATIAATGVLTLANTAVTPGTYGDATHVGQFTVDSKGRLTFAANVAITTTGSGPLLDGVHNTDTVAHTPVLGDMIYANGTPLWQALAGQITATRKFLRQTGTGAVSAAPVWDTILAADVPASALTKVDDTNVTLTLGGSPTVALLAATSITVVWAGLLSVARGGTGSGSLTAHGVVIGEGTSAVAVTAAGTAGQLLVGQGATSDPSFQTMSGDATLAASGALTLANTAVTPGSYGDATHVGTFTVDAKGRLTAASNVAIGGSPTVNTWGAQDFFPRSQWGKRMLFGSAASPTLALEGVMNNGGNPAFQGSAVSRVVDSGGAWARGNVSAAAAAGTEFGTPAVSAGTGAGQRSLLPIWYCRMRTGPAATDIAGARFWFGFSDVTAGVSSPQNGANPNTLHCAGFRFFPTVGDANWQTVSGNATAVTAQTTDSGVAVAAGTVYELIVDMSIAGNIDYYINGTLVHSETTVLPGNTTAMGLVGTGRQVTTGTARNLDWMGDTVRWTVNL